MAARDINWRAVRPDGTRYEVRVHWFGKAFRFQFRERGVQEWDFSASPTRQDLQALLDTIQRRYQRRQATIQQLEEAQRLLAECPE
jgi:hypothetical protein